MHIIIIAHHGMEVNMASFYKMDMMNTTRHLAILKVWPLDNTRPGNMLATHALTSTLALLNENWGGTQSSSEPSKCFWCKLKFNHLRVKCSLVFSFRSFRVTIKWKGAVSHKTRNSTHAQLPPLPIPPTRAVYYEDEPTLKHHNHSKSIANGLP